MPDVIWIALFVGAGLTVYFALFFGNRERAGAAGDDGHSVDPCSRRVVVIISLDHPFSGPVHIHADALSAVLEEFGKP